MYILTIENFILTILLSIICNCDRINIIIQRYDEVNIKNLIFFIQIVLCIKRNPMYSIKCFGEYRKNMILYRIIEYLSSD